MTEKQSTRNRDHDRTEDRFTTAVGRRRFIAVGAGVGATMLAGCTSAQSPTEADSSDESTADSSAGNFRLLISDRPADIGDFDRLDVSFDRARIFDGGDESNETDEQHDDSSEEETETEREGESETESGDADGDDDGDGGNTVERNRGFYVLDLQDATVDLTAVVGEKAVSVFEGELSDGRYEKIELYVSSIEGIVDGEQVDVQVPSEKLEITHPFEIGGDEPADFVFDINVVKRGQEQQYNLKPVISESGVAGKDVDVEEVGDGPKATGKRNGDESATDGDADADADDDADEGKRTDEGGNESDE